MGAFKLVTELSLNFNILENSLSFEIPFEISIESSSVSWRFSVFSENLNQL